MILKYIYYLLGFTAAGLLCVICLLAAGYFVIFGDNGKAGACVFLCLAAAGLAIRLGLLLFQLENV